LDKELDYYPQEGSAMQFGAILPNFGTPAEPRSITSFGKKAESLGYDSIWTTDHVLLPEADSSRFGRLYEAITTLAYLAGKTNTIRLGISSLVLPQRNPIIVAKQIAALDALSGGRAMLCIGVGWSEGEFKNLGEQFSNRGARMDEAVQILHLLLKNDGSEPLSFNGKYYQFNQGVFQPPSTQQSDLPIWVGGSSIASQRRAADLGDGWHPSSLGLDAFRQQVQSFLRLSGERTRAISLRIGVEFDTASSRAALQGTNRAIIDTLGEFQLAGLNYPVLAFQGESGIEMEENMLRFSEEIIPNFLP
jgi:probable F420-dependent oxidoreductase